MTEDDMNLAVKGLTTKSDKIRKLASLGASRSEIASYLNIRYQHVRNVLIAPAPSRGRVDQSASPSEVRGGAGVSVEPLSIDQAKLGLAVQFGVSPSAIEIIIRG